MRRGLAPKGWSLLAVLALPWSLAACQGPIAASPSVAARVMPVSHPARTVPQADPLLARAFLRHGATDLQDAAASLSLHLPGRARRDAENARMLFLMARVELAGAQAGPDRVPRLLSLATTRYLSASAAFMRATRGRQRALTRADREVELASRRLQEADAALAAQRGRLHAPVVQLPSQLEPAGPLPAASSPAPAPPAPTETPVVPTATAPAVPSASPTQATPLSLRPALAHPAETERAAGQRAALTRIATDLGKVPVRLGKVRHRIEVAASTPDYDPTLLRKAARGIQLTSSRLLRAERELGQLQVLAANQGVAQDVASAIRAYRAAAQQLNLALQQVQNGRHAALLAGLQAAQIDTANGDVALQRAENAGR